MAEKENVNLTALAPEYQGKWVVMSRETRKVFASNERPSEALIEEAQKRGCEDPILHKVLPFNKSFAS